MTVPTTWGRRSRSRSTSTTRSTRPRWGLDPTKAATGLAALAAVPAVNPLTIGILPEARVAAPVLAAGVGSTQGGGDLRAAAPGGGAPGDEPGATAPPANRFTRGLPARRWPARRRPGRATASRRFVPK